MSRVVWAEPGAYKHLPLVGDMPVVHTQRPLSTQRPRMDEMMGLSLQV